MTLIEKGSCLILLLATFLMPARASAQGRELLHLTAPSDELRTIVANLQDRDHGKVPHAELAGATRYFVRLVPRKYVVTMANELREDAILGTKPFVFLATPEGFYGKSLLEIYLDIGYEAEEIIRRQRNEAMVAVVFRYPDDITPSDVRDGHLPAPWDHKVYIPTWNNVFSILNQLSLLAKIEPGEPGGFAPDGITFGSIAERDFVLSYPEAGKSRIKSTDYATLKAVGGADWVYRAILESKLSLFEHFRGDGRTLNELSDPREEQSNPGLLEFIGPNRKLKDLPELAVIDLGSLIIEEATPGASGLDGSRGDRDSGRSESPTGKE